MADSAENFADPEAVPFVKMSDGDWLSPWEACSNEECGDYPDCGQISYALFKNSHMVGLSALVPIEVEEETRDHPGIVLPTDPPRYPQQSRLVTPWEEA